MDLHTCKYWTDESHRKWIQIQDGHCYGCQFGHRRWLQLFISSDLYLSVWGCKINQGTIGHSQATENKKLNKDWHNSGCQNRLTP